MTTTNPPSDGVARDLENAATLLRERGWCQNQYRRDDGACCAMGAIEATAGVSSRRALAAERLLLERLGCKYVEEWNDAPGRTADEVITALESAAALARASGAAS